MIWMPFIRLLESHALQAACHDPSHSNVNLQSRMKRLLWMPGDLCHDLCCVDLLHRGWHLLEMPIVWCIHWLVKVSIWDLQMSSSFKLP